ncbi:MAG: enoyl-CoA hydratase/isomerase family protein [Deltaproteobacteria bacterium]|nr:enoyl-CoA hydratase/isomerase family protein [Deltaproteobacteria bacterium]MBW2176285.1 enoyl-CoA hydratase/isomerase family protein [Deltaproteobacteria bacterium]
MTEYAFKNIIYDKDAKTGIVQITLNRPEIKNALTIVLLLELYDAVETAQADENVRGLILTGAKHPDQEDPSREAFSSGGYFDFSELESLDEETKSRIDFNDIALKRLCLKMWQMDKPVIVAMNGLAIGGGFTIPLACSDLIYASEHAWVRLPFVRLGIAPELASSYLLPRLLGFQKAKEIMFFGEKLSAQELCSMGIVNHVLPHGELLPYARQKMLELIPPLGAWMSVRQTKAILHKPLIAEVTRALDLENEVLNRLFGSSDFQEALNARLEKRDPSFKGA